MARVAKSFPRTRTLSPADLCDLGGLSVTHLFAANGRFEERTGGRKESARCNLI
jgi:hypothetical protein